MNHAACVSLTDPTFVAEARRTAVDLASGLGFTPEKAGNVAIVTTELATNVLKHAGSGEIIMTAGCLDTNALELVALDKGPGIGNVAESFRDGYSTAGSPGTGLGAITRLSDSLDLYTQAGRGTALLARIWNAGKAPLPHRPAGGNGIDIGGFSLPVRGERVSGDAWCVRRSPQGYSILTVDGLGHGARAAEAAQAAVESFLRRPEPSPVANVEQIHGALRATRGAAGAVAQIDLEYRQVRFSGIGNIAASVVDECSERNLVSMNGILGHEIRRLREFTYPWPPGATLLVHSDGLATKTNISDYPGLLNKPSVLIAGVLYRDYTRGRDDVTVVVARERATP